MNTFARALRGFVASAHVILVLAWSTSALAQSSTSKLSSSASSSGQTAEGAEKDSTKAQELYDEARAYLEAGDHEQACPIFEESQRLDPAASTQFWLATCYERAFRMVSARAIFLEVARTAAEAGEAARERIANEKVVAVEAATPHVTFTFEGEPVEGLSLSLDGNEVAFSELDLARPLDGGPHQIRGSAPGYESFTVDFSVERGDLKKNIVVPALKALQPATPTPAPQPTATSSAARTVGFVFLGVGVLATAGGGVLALLAKDKANAAECIENRCSGAGVVDRMDAVRLGNIATGAVIAGGALAAIGLTLVFLKPKSKTSVATLALSPQPMGATLWGTW